MNQLLLDVVELDLGSGSDLRTVYINVLDNTLSRKWLAALNHLIQHNYHLEKNYCFLGWADSARNGAYLIQQINASIAAINASTVDYQINNQFTRDNAVDHKGGVNHAQFNLLHRYFEDLQGTAALPSPLYQTADPATRWHIRQLNLLCHEFESWQLSHRKQTTAPEWQRPSQLMCWLNSPRFELEPADLELFGIDTINRSLGGVYVGVNKAVGKHHWEVFQDEGRDSRISELTTTSLAAQTLAAGDFDIEWANNPGAFEWQIRQLSEFRSWLINNGFDPADPALTIGHPQVAQVDLQRSFGTTDYRYIWAELNARLDVTAVRTSDYSALYPYHWQDSDYSDQQIQLL
jgi:hypothetical protein